MKKLIVHLPLIALLSLIFCFKALSCTTFCIRNNKQLVVGKNFDFYTGLGQVVINQRDKQKLAYPLPPEKQLTWTSKYGSITFNQLGKEFPYGGINEKGLVIEQMWLEETSYPEIDERYGLSEFQWIQYQLDNASTVAEVLASDALVRVSKILTAPIHFLVVDALGNVATIEYLQGEMVAHTGNGLPVCALANDTYEQSSGYLNSLSDAKKQHTASFTSGSFDRFAKAALMVEDYRQQPIIDYSFEVLSAVSQGPITYWSIVYDIRNRKVYYKTRNNQQVRMLALDDFDYACNSTSLYLDIEEVPQLAAVNFKPYSYQQNKALVEQVFAELEKLDFMKPLIPSEAEIEQIARYSDTATCNKIDRKASVNK